MQNDILKEFLARKTFIFPPEPSIRLSLRRDRVRGRDAAAVQPDLDHGLPRARGRLRRRPGARAHAGLCDRVRRTARGTRAGVRHLRAPAVVPLRDDDGSVRGGGEAPSREADVVPDRDRAVRRDRSQLGTPAVLLGELGHDADRAAAAQQRDPVDDPVSRRGPGRGAVDPRDGLRRGVRDPVGRGRHPVAADAADRGARVRRATDGRPVGRLLLRRVAHRRARTPRRGRARGAGRDGWRGRGDREGGAPAVDRGVGVSDRT